MTKPPREKNPTFGISVFIVVAILVVIVTLFYNAIREKQEFDSHDAQVPPVASEAAAAANAAANAMKPASGAAQ
ncbi:putative signal peptide transmembrane protein [Burkholderia sp. H160]|nr:putative signal peptide transmembrane protein [Burkholderia sp. H160]